MRQPKFGFPDSPVYYLQRYKHSVRPRPCQYCYRNDKVIAAYYYQQDIGYACASHLLDMASIYLGARIQWEEYQEIDKRMSRLLQRESTTAPIVMDWVQPDSYVVEETENGLGG